MNALTFVAILLAAPALTTATQTSACTFSLDYGSTAGSIQITIGSTGAFTAGTDAASAMQGSGDADPSSGTSVSLTVGANIASGSTGTANDITGLTAGDTYSFTVSVTPAGATAVVCTNSGTNAWLAQMALPQLSACTLALAKGASALTLTVTTANGLVAASTTYDGKYMQGTTDPSSSGTAVPASDFGAITSDLGNGATTDVTVTPGSYDMALDYAVSLSILEGGTGTPVVCSSSAGNYVSTSPSPKLVASAALVLSAAAVAYFA